MSYEITFTVEGIADFLFNRLSEDAIKDFVGGTSGGTLTDEQRDKLAEGRVYADETSLYLPPWTMKRLLLDGAFTGRLKIGKTPLHKLVAAMVFVQGPARFLRDGAYIVERDYLHKVPGRQPPKKGGMAIIRRPALTLGWQLTGTLAVLDDDLPSDPLRDALAIAGLRVGVGSWRPEHGRFLVRAWSVEPRTAPVTHAPIDGPAKRARKPARNLS